MATATSPFETDIRNLSAPAPVHPPENDRRRHRRVTVTLAGRFMLESGEEHRATVRNVSPGGTQLRTDAEAKLGERVILYLDELGRFEGAVSRLDESGFAVRFDSSPAKLEKTANALTWLVNRHRSPDLEKRKERRVPRSDKTELRLSDGSTADCKVIDMSICGASVAVTPRPPIGARVGLGQMEARVVRYHDAGIGLEFLVNSNGGAQPSSQAPLTNL